MRKVLSAQILDFEKLKISLYASLWYLGDQWYIKSDNERLKADLNFDRSYLLHKGSVQNAGSFKK